MARLEAWAEAALRTVDEKGDSTARVRLLTPADNSCWQTWDAPFGDVAEWVQQAEALVSELSNDFTGEVQFLFVAESLSGTVRSQCPRLVVGKKARSNNRPGGALFGDDGPAASLQKMYEAQARTVEKTLQSANVQLEVLTRTVETQARAHAELLDYIRAKNETEALEQKAEQSVQAMLAQGLEQLPLLLSLIQENAKAKKAKVNGNAVAAVVDQVKESVGTAVTDAAVSAATNGAKALMEGALGKG